MEKKANNTHRTAGSDFDFSYGKYEVNIIRFGHKKYQKDNRLTLQTQ